MYYSTKHYEQEFPVAYRQWRADRKSGKPDGTPYSGNEIPGCNAIHGYALSFTFFFRCETVDARNWVVDYGSLRPLKEFLKENFDHTLLLAVDDPHYETIKALGTLGLAKVVEVEATGCEALSKFLVDYTNEMFLPIHYPNSGIECYKVEVRETPSNMAFYELDK